MLDYERIHTEHIAMVRHGDSLLVEGLNLPDLRLDLIRVVEEAELVWEMPVHVEIVDLPSHQGVAEFSLPSFSKCA
jgi:hypothetical protein